MSRSPSPPYIVPSPLPSTNNPKLVSPLSFSTASNDSLDPTIPIVSRTRGLQGFASERNENNEEGSAANEDVEAEVMAWKLEVLKLEKKGEEEEGEKSLESPQVSVDPHFPSVPAPRQESSKETHFLSPSSSPPSTSGNSGLVEDWRNALKVAHNGSNRNTPSPFLKMPSMSPPPPPATRPSLPPLVFSPPSAPTSACSSFSSNVLPSAFNLPSQNSDNDSTPLAHPAFQAAFATQDGFVQFHDEIVNPGQLPLPDVPTDYIFPDQRGRASFSNTPDVQSPPLTPPSTLPRRNTSQQERRRSAPTSPALESLDLSSTGGGGTGKDAILSSPSAVSGLPSPLVMSPPSPFVVHGVSSGERKLSAPGPILRLPSCGNDSRRSTSPGAKAVETLIELYQDCVGSRHPSETMEVDELSGEGELEEMRARMRRLEEEVALLRREKEGVKKGSLEGALAAQGVDPSSSLVLLLPPSLAHLTHCPRCSLPLVPPSSSSFDPEPGYYPSANPFLRSHLAASAPGGEGDAGGQEDEGRRRMQGWVERHWGCLPRVGGMLGGVRAVSFGEGREEGR